MPCGKICDCPFEDHCECCSECMDYPCMCHDPDNSTRACLRKWAKAWKEKSDEKEEAKKAKID